MVILGPFIIESRAQYKPTSEFQHTGYSLEISIDDRLTEYPIFQKIPWWTGFRLEFDDLYVLGNDGEWPVTFGFRNFQAGDYPQGTLVKISPLLRGIFAEIPNHQELQHFLEEIRQRFEVQEGVEVYAPQHLVLLAAGLAEAGFVVGSVNHYGSRLFVGIEWEFPKRGTGWNSIRTSGMEIRLSNGRLDRGKWRPYWPESVEELFFEQFRKLTPKLPIDCFATSKEIEQLLKHVEWNPLLTTRPKDLKNARIQFVAQFLHLREKPMELARLLSEAGLSAKSTSRSQIAKTVPALLAAAESATARA